MVFLNRLHEDLNKFNLLDHEFYQLWNCGELKSDALKIYAQEYYHHVAAFPRYISAIHSRCDNLPHRQVLLGNLMEEELGEENHPELWLRFLDGVGGERKAALTPPKYQATQKLVQGYYDLVNNSYAEGLGALYAYERQTPEVAASKIKGLKEFYGVADDRTLQFFTVHEKADQWHSDECAGLIAALDPELQKKAHQGAIKGAELLWGFLDEMLEVNTVLSS